MPSAPAHAPVATHQPEAPYSGEQYAHDAPFMPPQPEQVLRAPRMPRVDELPVPAQNQIRAHQESEGKRPGLLQRLATVGFGRRDENQQPAQGYQHEAAPRQEYPGQPAQKPAAQMPAAPAPMPAAPQAAPVHAQRPAAPGMSPAHAEFAKRPAAPQGYRPAQGQLDAHGRGQAPARGLDDDQLEIPAFLRRQAQ